MKFGVVIFPGSNCDQDMIYTLEGIMKQEVVRLWHKERSLQNCDFIMLPGGFSYGDYLRSGAIARFSPIMEEVIAFANKGGFVMGVCNGFQILCEAGLLPGALLHNNNQQFICKNTYIRVETTESKITSGAQQGMVLKIPIAHGEGRYYAGDEMLQEIEANNQVLFRYCSAEGQTADEWNPNGAINHIAGICNKGRNVFGMMPHPERCADKELYNADGRILFESILKN
jgi:phosphoribosylformylglycinamidine synthase subunit PurQ / glutaminase